MQDKQGNTKNSIELSSYLLCREIKDALVGEQSLAVRS